ncbi:MAG TPA: T9SS type A sorting domain-containing protein [Saprospiraceae bacterium]|nr:T9SS type A sorting domain-containing protein [Saprospiraceae bacterium]
MKTTYYISFAFIMLMATIGQAQTMRWVPAPTGMGTCPNQSGGKEQTLSYALEYTPAVSGVLTSYTTGFLVSCTTEGSAVAKNQSRVMTSKSREISGCNTMGSVLMNSSGNSGNAIHNTIEAGVPVLLHLVCLTIPKGEAVTIQEEVVTDLTTSIDIGSGESITEFPTFEGITIGRPKLDQGPPMHLLDFKSNAAGDFISQLDWSTSQVVNLTQFVIERSVDGIVFAPIGTMDVSEKSGQINSYQFFDKEAVAGNNYYRLLQVNPEGNNEYSPVRIVDFTPKTFSVTFTPNPADEYLHVNVQSPSGIKNIRLVDASGRIVMEEKDNNKNFNARLDVKKLTAGIYTLVVETENDNFSEKVVIAH